MQQEYQPELATLELIVEVRRLLATERRVERLICRYLADLADRIRHRLDAVLWAYADELHATRCIFGFGVRETRERVRVGRALRRLPRVEAAFVSGEVSYSRVRELTRVAEPSTEMDWLELARSLDMRAFERRVAAARERAPSATGEPHHEASRPARTEKAARTEWLTPNTVRVTFELTAETWGLLERALEGARRCADDTVSATDALTSDTEALAAVARDALTAQNQNADASDPRCSVVVYECQRCQRSELETKVGPLELQPASAASLCCGRSELHLASEGRVVKRGCRPLPSALRRAVMLRDRSRCRVPGCNRRRYVDVHHIVAQSGGGEHSRSNCVVLCTTHHHLLHDGKLELTGDAEGELCFRDAQGRPLVKRELEGDRFVGHTPSLGELPTGNDGNGNGGCSPRNNGADHPTTHSGSPSHPAAERLLHAIGRRGVWSLDALIEKLGLPAKAVAAALTELELRENIRYRDFTYEPI